MKRVHKMDEEKLINTEYSKQNAKMAAWRNDSLWA